MNRIYTGIVCLYLLFSACNRPATFHIRGSFAVADSTPVKLFILNEESRTLIDSVMAGENNFRLSGPIDQPGIYQLSFFNDQHIYLVIFPGDRIQLDIDNTKRTLAYYVDKSPESRRVKELVDKQNFVLRQVDLLSQEWEQNPADSSQRRKIDSAYMMIMREQKEFSREFIYSQPKSLANIMSLYQNFGRKSQPLFDPYDDFGLFRFVDSNLVAAYPYSAPVIALNQSVNQIKDQIKHSEYINKVVETGRPMPSLRSPDINGDTIRIDYLMQKPALVLFWASWNPYSVKQLELVDGFFSSPEAQKYTVLTVSLDTDEKILKEFIASRNLKVPVVCDYAFWDSHLVGRFAVKRIPAVLLSNREGLIVAKDVFDNELLTKLIPQTK